MDSLNITPKLNDDSVVIPFPVDRYILNNKKSRLNLSSAGFLIQIKVELFTLLQALTLVYQSNQ